MTKSKLSQKNVHIQNSCEYFRLSDAALQVDCHADNLLHLGAIGMAEIMAPVLMGGTYEWSVSWDGTPYPELEPPFRADFDAADRVVLSKTDVAKIEAIGWVIPTFFFAPSKGLEIAKNWRGSSFFEPLAADATLSDAEVRRLKFYSSFYHPLKPTSVKTAVPHVEADLQAKFIKKMQENIVSIPWYPYIEDEYKQVDAKTELDGASAKITMDQLFISKNELTRLINGDPQGSVALIPKQYRPAQEKEHGLKEVHALPRLAILEAAIYCRNKWPEDCIDGGGQVDRRLWTTLIESKADKFWPAGAPPLATDTIERLIGNALRSGDDDKTKN